MFISNPPKPIHLTPYYILHLHTCSRPKASQQTGNDLEPLLFVVRWSKKKAQAQAHIFFIFYLFILLLYVSPGCFSLFFISAIYFIFIFFLSPFRVSRLLLFIVYSLSLLFISLIYFTCGLLFILYPWHFYDVRLSRRSLLILRYFGLCWIHFWRDESWLDLIGLTSLYM